MDEGAPGPILITATFVGYKVYNLVIMSTGCSPKIVKSLR